MPLELASSTEEAAREIDELSTETNAETQNPFSVGGRAQALVELILRVTDDNHRSLSSDEFTDLSFAYERLEEFEKLELRTELARRGIYWGSTLADTDDDLDGTNYEAYVKLSTVTT